ncbi:MAG TPA: T9SS type A sorting domain-containing protein, partial [Chitinophagaceae bacterium]|nr:T9SS type A sorting domain-containing protein [Chitinophagaceae bacterium]
RAIASVLCGTTTSSAATLNVSAPPVINTSPQSITLCAGSNHTFTFTATGGNSYQWELSTDGGASFNPIPGANQLSYTITGITAGMNNYRYRVVVSSGCPPAATSAAAILTVVTAVAVTTQPSDATVCAGSNTSFQVAGSGTGIIYQWQVSTDGGTNYTNLTDGGLYSGVTGPVLNITGATAAMNGYRYRAQLTNSTCSTPGISNAGVLTVNTLPAISGNPQNVTICLGSNTAFTATATGTGISYQWQISTDNGANWNDISGANTSNYAVTNVTAGMNGYQYRVVVNGVCPPPAISTAATLTVINPATITTQPSNIELCSGSNATFTVTGNSSQPILYQWEMSTDGGANWSVIAGANSSSYTVPNTTTAQSGNQYRVSIANATCNSPTTSNVATLTVRQLPSITLGSPASLAPGQSATLTASPSTSTGGTVSVTWTYNNNPLANTGNTYAVNVEKAGDYKVRIQETWTSGLVCATESAVVTIAAPASDRLFVFPSPNDGEFTVSFYNSSGNNSKRTITLYDAHGAKVYHAQFTVSGAYTLVPVNIKTAARGIYYIVVGDANGKRIAKGNVVVH